MMVSVLSGAAVGCSTGGVTGASDTAMAVSAYEAIVGFGSCERGDDRVRAWNFRSRPLVMVRASIVTCYCGDVYKIAVRINRVN